MLLSNKLFINKEKTIPFEDDNKLSAYHLHDNYHPDLIYALFKL